MSFFGGGSSSSSSAPKPTLTSTDTKNQLIDNIRREMAVNTAQSLIEVGSGKSSVLTTGDQSQLLRTVYQQPGNEIRHERAGSL